MKQVYLSIFAFFLAINISSAQTPLTEAVDFTVTTVHGEEFNLFEKLDEGKHVVIDFFFTTCPPCIESVPTVNESYEKYGCNMGDVYYISIDNGDSEQEVLDYETQYGGLIPSVSGNDGGGNQVNSDYQIPAYPTIILIAPDRSIVSQDIFPVTHENFDNAMAIAGIEENPDACMASSLWDLEASSSTILGTFPNPASTEAVVDFSVEQATDVRFEIYNVMGQQVASVATQNFVEGQHQAVLPVANLANGNYTIHLITAEGTADVSKLMIVK